MLAFVAIFIITSIVASVFVVAATMLSSRLSHTEDNYLAEEVEVDHGRPDVSAGQTSQSPS